MKRKIGILASVIFLLFVMGLFVDAIGQPPLNARDATEINKIRTLDAKPVTPRDRPIVQAKSRDKAEGQVCTYGRFLRGGRYMEYCCVVLSTDSGSMYCFYYNNIYLDGPPDNCETMRNSVGEKLIIKKGQNAVFEVSSASSENPSYSENAFHYIEMINDGLYDDRGRLINPHVCENVWKEPKHYKVYMIESLVIGAQPVQ